MQIFSFADWQNSLAYYRLTCEPKKNCCFCKTFCLALQGPLGVVDQACVICKKEFTENMFQVFGMSIQSYQFENTAIHTIPLVYSIVLSSTSVSVFLSYLVPTLKKVANKVGSRLQPFLTLFQIEKGCKRLLMCLSTLLVFMSLYYQAQELQRTTKASEEFPQNLSFSLVCKVN